MILLFFLYLLHLLCNGSFKSSINFVNILISKLFLNCPPMQTDRDLINDKGSWLHDSSFSLEPLTGLSSDCESIIHSTDNILLRTAFCSQLLSYYIHPAWWVGFFGKFPLFKDLLWRATFMVNKISIQGFLVCLVDLNKMWLKVDASILPIMVFCQPFKAGKSRCPFWL